MRVWHVVDAVRGNHHARVHGGRGDHPFVLLHRCLPGKDHRRGSLFLHDEVEGELPDRLSGRRREVGSALADVAARAAVADDLIAASKVLGQPLHRQVADAGPAQPLGHGWPAAGVQVDGQRHLHVGHAGRVEVGLERQVHPLALYLLQGRTRVFVHALVADVHGTARSLGQLDGLPPRDRSAQVRVALVGGVDAAVLGGDLAQAHQLLEACVGARLIVQPQAERAGAGVHPLAGPFLHRLQLVRGRVAGIPSHGPQPHGAVRDLREHVQRRRAGEAVQVGVDGRPARLQVRAAVEGRGVGEQLLAPGRVERRPAEAVRSQQVGGDPLSSAHQAVVAGEQRQLRVHVHVDEARSDRQAGGVDGGVRRGGAEVADGGDRFALQADVRRVGGTAGAVDDRTAGDEHGEGRSGIQAHGGTMSPPGRPRKRPERRSHSRGWGWGQTEAGTASVCRR